MNDTSTVSPANRLPESGAWQDVTAISAAISNATILIIRFMNILL